MTKKDSLAILGLLYTIKYNVYTLDDDNDCLVLDYLRRLNLSYAFVRDILTGDYGSNFYHDFYDKPLPKKYKKDELYTSEYDYVEIDENGRVGIWCEVDGFVAWLDEYEKVWIVDSRKEVAEQRRKNKEYWDRVIGPKIKKSVEKIFNNPQPPETNVDFTAIDKSTIKIAKFHGCGLAEYKTKDEKK